MFFQTELKCPNRLADHNQTEAQDVGAQGRVPLFAEAARDAHCVCLSQLSNVSLYFFVSAQRSVGDVSLHVFLRFRLTLAPRCELLLQTELAYIDILANLKIRLDDVKRMTQIQNTP